MTRWWAGLGAADRAFVVSRLGLLLWGWLALTVQPQTAPGLWHAFADWPLLNGWSRQDSGWYASVALDGYYYAPGQPSNVNFFPLYSWLALGASLPLRWFMQPTQAFHLAGQLLSLGLFWLSLRGVWQLAAQRLGQEVANRTVWLVALFPFSLFFSAVYTESLFLALSVWAFVHAERGRWWQACLLAAGCAVTRSVGGLVGIGLALVWLQQRGWQRPASVLALGLVPLPLAGLMAWWHSRFGHPLPFLLTQTQVWDKRPGLSRLRDVVGSIRSAAEDPHIRLMNSLQLLCVLGVLVLVVWGRKRLGWGLTVYAIGSALLVALTGFNGSGRYMAVLFPAFVVLAQADKAQRVLRAVFGALLLYVSWDFVHARWVT